MPLASVILASQNQGIKMKVTRLIVLMSLENVVKYKKKKPPPIVYRRLNVIIGNVKKIKVADRQKQLMKLHSTKTVSAGPMKI